MLAHACAVFLVTATLLAESKYLLVQLERSSSLEGNVSSGGINNPLVFRGMQNDEGEGGKGEVGDVDEVEEEDGEGDGGDDTSNDNEKSDDPDPFEAEDTDGTGGSSSEEESDSNARECSKSSDCPAYYYCYNSYTNPRKCVTVYKVIDDAPSCAEYQPDGRTKFPNHNTCQTYEKKTFNLDSSDESTMRCFEELNFRCSRSYFSPCSPDFDSSGAQIEGKQESCPPGFKCSTRQASASPEEGSSLPVRVCTPIIGDSYAYRRCTDNFQCGYSMLVDAWIKCSEGSCSKPVE